jgi:hypothetical protein
MSHYRQNRSQFQPIHAQVTLQRRDCCLFAAKLRAFIHSCAPEGTVGPTSGGPWFRFEKPMDPATKLRHNAAAPRR